MNDLEGDVSPWKEQSKILDGYSLEASIFDTCLILLLVETSHPVGLPGHQTATWGSAMVARPRQSSPMRQARRTRKFSSHSALPLTQAFMSDGVKLPFSLAATTMLCSRESRSIGSLGPAIGVIPYRKVPPPPLLLRNTVLRTPCCFTTYCR